MRLRTANGFHFVEDVQFKSLEEKVDDHGLSRGILVLFLCDHKVVLTLEGSCGSWLLG